MLGFASLGRVTQRLHEAAFSRLDFGDATVQSLKVRQVLPPVPGGAVFAQHRIQTQILILALLKQTLQRPKPLDALADVVRPQHLPRQRWRHPLEQGEIQQQFAVLLRQVAQQPFAEPFGIDAVGGELLHGHGRVRASGRLYVAHHPQGDWPALGALFQRREFPQRQSAIEEAIDLGGGEAQLIGADLNAVAADDNVQQVEARVVAHRQGDMQIRRPVLQQEIDGGHRVAVA